MPSAGADSYSHRMSETISVPTARRLARTAGIVYLVIIVLGVFAELFVRQRLFVPDDPAATARNLVDHALLFRFGFLANLALLPCNAIIALCFYELLKVVDRRLALLLVFFLMSAATIEGVNLVSHLAPLVVATSDTYAAAFPGGQADALAYLPFALQPVGFAISLFVFAGYCLIGGYLIYRSGFLPRALGVLLAVAGVCYTTNSLAFFLAPSLKDQFVLILVPCFVGESALAVWLTLAGVNGERWRQRAERSRVAVADQVAATPVS
jgi:hypothetical protein